MTKYGLLLPKDAEILDRCIKAVATDRGDIRICEIGLYDGETARGFREVVEGLGKRIWYTGIDKGRYHGLIRPYKDDLPCKILYGSSEEIWTTFGPDEVFDFIFIDGCHCVNHAMLDFLNYTPFLRIDGIVAFHDTHPACQGVRDYQGHGPDNHHFRIAIVEAMTKLGLNKEESKNPCFVYFDSGFEERHDWGGVTAWKKIR